MSALRYIAQASTADNDEFLVFDNIFTADFDVYKIYYNWNGSNNNAWGLAFLNNGKLNYAKGDYHRASRTIYSHTSTSDSNSPAQSYFINSGGSSYRGASEFTIFNPFDENKITSVCQQNMAWSSTSVCSARPMAGVLDLRGRVTGIYINSESGELNAGNIYVYGLASI